MAEGTCLKDLVADMKKMNDYVEHVEVSTGARMERLEKLIEAMTQTPNVRMDQIESSIEKLTRAVENSNLNNQQIRNHNADMQGSQAATVQYQPFQLRQVKLDFPRFDENDPLHWLFRAEQFFEYYETPDTQRITIAAVHMEGKAVPWFHMMQKTNQIPTWKALAQAIENQFGPSRFESPRAQLLKLTQKETVADYYQQFMLLVNRVEGMSEDAIMDCFISGLKPEIRLGVIAKAPSNLLDASSLARLYDEKQSFSVVNRTRTPSSATQFNRSITG